MYQLVVKDTDELIGEIDENELQYLIDALEEESLGDQDYAITPMLLEMFRDENVSMNLLELLFSALGEREEVVIYWRSQALS